MCSSDLSFNGAGFLANNGDFLYDAFHTLDFVTGFYATAVFCRSSNYDCFSACRFLDSYNTLTIYSGVFSVAGFPSDGFICSVGW